MRIKSPHQSSCHSRWTEFAIIFNICIAFLELYNVRVMLIFYIYIYIVLCHHPLASNFSSNQLSSSCLITKAYVCGDGKKQCSNHNNDLFTAIQSGILINWKEIFCQLSMWNNQKALPIKLFLEKNTWTIFANDGHSFDVEKALSKRSLY